MDYTYKPPAGLCKTVRRAKSCPKNIAFTVSDVGSDSGTGSAADPFRTLERARDAVRERRASGCIGHMTVEVKGNHNLSGFVLDERDSDVEWISLDGSVLSGGMTFKSDRFTALDDEEKGRLHGDAVNAVRKCDLRALGLTQSDWGKIYPIGAFNSASKYDGDNTGVTGEVFFNGKRMTLARYPNGNEFLSISGVIDIGDVAEYPEQNYFHDWGERRNHRAGAYIMDKQTSYRAAEWKKPELAWMFGYFYHDWADSSTPVDSIDAAHRTVRPKHVSRYGCRQGAKYFFYNVFEELDAPGEYYIDREKGVLYIYPTDESEYSVTLSNSREPIIKLNGADNITLCGFTFAHTLSDALSIRGDGNTVTDCTVENILGNAIAVSGSGNTVKRCEIRYTGRGGIILSGGDRATLTAGNNRAENNLIHDWAEVFPTYQPAVGLNGVGNVCAHNEIYNSPHMAVLYGGNDHIIEYNLIHDVVKQSSDAGAIYSGMDWAAHGTVIRHNCLYNIGAEGYHPDGIYWDDALSGQTAYGNILINIAKNGFLIGGGRDNTVRNNLIINAGCAISYDSRARDGVVSDGWAKEAYNSFNGRGWKSLTAVPYQSRIWAERFPELAKIRYDFDDPDDPNFPPNPSHSAVEGNIVIDRNGKTGSIADAVYRYGSVGENPTYTFTDDAGFIDAVNGDYSFREDADPLKKLPDFEKIDFSHIGREEA